MSGRCPRGMGLRQAPGGAPRHHVPGCNRKLPGRGMLRLRAMSVHVGVCVCVCVHVYVYVHVCVVCMFMCVCVVACVHVL